VLVVPYRHGATFSSGSTDCFLLQDRSKQGRGCLSDLADTRCKVESGVRSVTIWGVESE
jgi:hypothetical protein